MGPKAQGPRGGQFRSALAFNALAASDALLIPVAAGFPSVAGLEPLFRTMSLVRARMGLAVPVLGVFATLVRPTRHARDVVAGLIDRLGPAMFETVIPLNVAVEAAALAGLSAVQFAPKSRGAVAYERLAAEIVRRTGLVGA